MNHRFFQAIKPLVMLLVILSLMGSRSAYGFWGKWHLEREINSYQTNQRVTETELKRLMVRIDQSFYLPMFDGERHLLIRLFTKAYRKYLKGDLKIEALMRRVKSDPCKYAQWFDLEIDQVGHRSSFALRREYLFSKLELWELLQYQKRFPELVDFASLVYYIYTNKRLPIEVDHDDPDYDHPNITVEDYEPNGINLFFP